MGMPASKSKYKKNIRKNNKVWEFLQGFIKTNNGTNWAFEQASFLFEKNYGIEIITVCCPMKKRGGWHKNIKKAKMPVVKVIFRYRQSLCPVYYEKELKILKENCRFISTRYYTYLICLSRIWCLESHWSRNIPRDFSITWALHLKISFKKVEYFLNNKNDFWIGTCKDILKFI